MSLRPPLPNSYWVLPERMLAGEHPFGEDPLEAQDRFAGLRDAHIDYFIDLTEIGERPAYQRLLHRSADYLRFPIVDCGLPESDEQMHRIQAAIRSALAGGRNLYIHCRAGIGRTGLAVGCYLAEQGLAGKAALQELNRLWKQSERAKTWPSIPQTEPQAEFIRRWSGLRKAG